MYCLYSSLWLVSAFVTSSSWGYFRPLLSRLSPTTWRELCLQLVVDTDLFCTSWSQLSSALFKIKKKGDYLHFQKMKVQTSLIFLTKLSLNMIIGRYIVDIWILLSRLLKPKPQVSFTYCNVSVIHVVNWIQFNIHQNH